jgi:membrane fusion protein, multidrug efflux system
MGERGVSRALALPFHTSREKNMRSLSVLMALLVGLGLYLAVMERDLLLRLAGAEASEAAVEPERAEAPTEAVSVVVRRSRARVVDSGLVLRGRTEASRRVEVRAETTGRVASEPLRGGAVVGAGDVLCELDAGSRLAQLAEAEARLLEAEGNERASARLAERGFGAEQTAIAQRAALQTAQAMVDQARREIERLVIRAPFPGILIEDSAELGDLLQPGSSCAAMISVEPIKLTGFAAEAAVERIVVGAPVRARLVTGQEIAGAVTFVARAADPASRTFRVEAQSANPDARIRDGISAEIVVGLPGTEAHLLPTSALTLDDGGRLGIRAAVRGDAGPEAAFFPVSVIRDDRQGAWVAGLPEELDVIVVGQDFVTDGQLLRVSRTEGSTP